MQPQESRVVRAHDEPLPRSWLPTVLAVTITAVGVIAAVVVVAAG